MQHSHCECVECCEPKRPVLRSTLSSATTLDAHEREAAPARPATHDFSKMQVHTGTVMRKPAPKRVADASDDPCIAPDPQLPSFDSKEETKRAAILRDMLRGTTADEKKSWCKRIRRAMAAFSTSQLLVLNTAGVRFWRIGSYPPPFDKYFAPSQSKRNEMARYDYGVRVIHMEKGGVDEVRHELAHAWDHVRDSKMARLDKLTGEKLKKAVENPGGFSSDKRVKAAFDAFMKRPASSYWSFANTKTNPEHVTSNVREFYAEGYSVFHSGNEDAQAQLLCDAPELFDLLEKEAKAGKLAAPSRQALEKNNIANNRKCATP